MKIIITIEHDNGTTSQVFPTSSSPTQVWLKKIAKAVFPNAKSRKKNWTGSYDELWKLVGPGEWRQIGHVVSTMSILGNAYPDAVSRKIIGGKSVCIVTPKIYGYL